MAYLQHYWLEVVGSHRFSVYRLRHKTNNFIESYYASLLGRMDQNSALYVFYGNIKFELLGINDTNFYFLDSSLKIHHIPSICTMDFNKIYN